MSRTDDDLRTMLADGTLTTSLLGDVCDRHGFYHQFLPPAVHCQNPALTLVGRAMPVLTAEVFSPQPRPFGRLTDALDQLQPGEVYVGGGGLMRNASWGELLTVIAKERGAAGAVIDGWHRDTRAVNAEQWPVYSRGSYGQDAGVRSQVLDFRVCVELGRVTIQPGSLVVADVDGVLVLPPAMEQEIIEGALEKSGKERELRAAILGGMSSTDAWNTYGVL